MIRFCLSLLFVCFFSFSNAVAQGMMGIPGASPIPNQTAVIRTTATCDADYFDSRDECLQASDICYSQCGIFGGISGCTNYCDADLTVCLDGVQRNLVACHASVCLHNTIIYSPETTPAQRQEAYLLCFDHYRQVYGLTFPQL
jgi:hypothetical protein